MVKFTNVYVDQTLIANIPMPYFKSIKIGDVITINHEPYRVWDIDESGTHRKVRVERWSKLATRAEFLKGLALSIALILLISLIARYFSN